MTALERANKNYIDAMVELNQARKEMLEMKEKISSCYELISFYKSKLLNISGIDIKFHPFEIKKYRLADHLQDRT